MAKEVSKTFKKTYQFDRETTGAWLYVVDGDQGQRHSGTYAVYLQKQDYKNKPGDVIEATFVIK